MSSYIFSFRNLLSTRQRSSSHGVREMLSPDPTMGTTLRRRHLSATSGFGSTTHTLLSSTNQHTVSEADIDSNHSREMDHLPSGILYSRTSLP